MKQVGSLSLRHLPDIVFSVINPWVALGILFLLGFFACYMTALSWADLTYVLPATSLSYVLLTLIAKFFLHEAVSTSRWLGVLLVAVGVGFVTQGPALTHKHPHSQSDEYAAKAASANMGRTRMEP
jgi:drug/metabolite transporter (DMT)-like permease